MLIFGLMFLVLGLPAWANLELITQIEDVDFGRNPKDEVLVFLKSGHVAKLHQSNAQMHLDNLNSKSNQDWFKINLNKHRYITSATKITVPNIKLHKKKSNYLKQLPMTFIPTTIANMNTARKYHREARYNPKESQCFNRAMVWSYEWWRKHSLKSMKILIFFSRSYIRRYNFEWWFHIAPYVHIMDNGKVVERVMDIKYSRSPLDFQRWANIFMRNNAPCPVIKKYSEFADFPYTGDCYFQRTHMYTYQPADLQMYEAWGYSKDNFRLEELRWAYLDAFDEQF